MNTHEKYWPLFGLRLIGRRIELRPTTEADLASLADLLPADSEVDPSLPSHDVDPALAPGVALYQAYWRTWASWTAESWTIQFSVRLNGELVGVSSLEAENFPRRGVVGTGSWLAEQAQGRGVGKEMRAAVLHLAFASIGASVAETEAWHDNQASLGVSRALGYEPNGETIHVYGERRDRMVRMRLTRDAWMRTAPEWPTEVEGLEPCLPYFKLARDVS